MNSTPDKHIAAANLDTLVRSWKARLDFLIHQLDELKSGSTYGHEQVGIAGLGQANKTLIPDDIRRVELWISELRGLLATHASS